MNEARRLLAEAMARHERNDIASAIEAARQAIDVAPDFADAHAYLGSTLVQRLRRYVDGLAELERAVELAPDDPALHYTLGWCSEFVAHNVSRRGHAGPDPQALYKQAEEHLRRCLELNPQGKLKDDAQDLLSAIIREDVG